MLGRDRALDTVVSAGLLDSHARWREGTRERLTQSNRRTWASLLRSKQLPAISVCRQADQECHRQHSTGVINTSLTEVRQGRVKALGVL